MQRSLQVLMKMDQYDHGGNSSILHTWLSHSGDPDDIVHLPSSTYGIDANQTFEYVKEFFSILEILYVVRASSDTSACKSTSHTDVECFKLSRDANKFQTR